MTTGRPAGGRLLASYRGPKEPRLVLGDNANQNAVLRGAERDLLGNTVAVYEVPL